MRTIKALAFICWWIIFYFCHISPQTKITPLDLENPRKVVDGRYHLDSKRSDSRLLYVPLVYHEKHGSASTLSALDYRFVAAFAAGSNLGRFSPLVHNEKYETNFFPQASRLIAAHFAAPPQQPAHAKTPYSHSTT